jgi:hypothetical protein
MEKYKGSKKYKLNYIYVNYNDKTGFCYKNKTEFSFLESYEKQGKENTKYWKCEKYNNLFSRFKQLKRHNEELQALVRVSKAVKAHHQMYFHSYRQPYRYLGEMKTGSVARAIDNRSDFTLINTN